MGRTSFLLLLLTTVGCMHGLAIKGSSMANVAPVGSIRHGVITPSDIKPTSTAKKFAVDHEDENRGWREIKSVVMSPAFSKTVEMNPAMVQRVGTMVQDNETVKNVGWIGRMIKRFKLDKLASFAGGFVSFVAFNIALYLAVLAGCGMFFIKVTYRLLMSLVARAAFHG